MNRFLAALFAAFLLPTVAFAQAPGSNAVTTKGNLVPGNCTEAANKSQIQDSGIDCSGGAGAFATKNLSNTTSTAFGAVVLNAGGGSSFTTGNVLVASSANGAPQDGGAAPKLTSAAYSIYCNAKILRV